MTGKLGAVFAASSLLVAIATAALADRRNEVVYIPLGGNGEIAVVDTVTDTVAAKIPGVPAVHGLAGTPDGRFLIAGSFDERDPGTAAPQRPSGVSEDDHASHHAAPPPGAGNQGAKISTVSIVDRSRATVVRRIDVPGAVHHVAVSPEGRFAAVTRPRQGGISVIDLSSYQVVASIPTGPLANYAAFSPDSETLYVSNAGNDTVSAVDTDRWIVKWNVVVGTSPEHLVLSADAARLLVNNVDDGTVSIVDTTTQKVESTLAVGGKLHGIDLGDDGETLFVAALEENLLVAIDLRTGNSRNNRLAPAPYHLAIIHGTEKLYVSSGDEPKLWVVDAKSLQVIGEIAVGGKGHQMVQQPL